MILLFSLLLTAVLTGLFVFLSEKRDLLRADRFSRPEMKAGAYALLAALLMVVVFQVLGSAQAGGSKVDLSQVSFLLLFSFHVILIAFLVGWWALTERPPLTRYLNLFFDDLPRNVLLGVAIGIGGWLITIGLAVLAGLLISLLGFTPDDLKPSPMIPWMASLPLWKKALIVLSAMTVEEAFFRGWLQKRVGLAASTVFFALAHAGYGQPFMLVGVTIISVVIGITFYKTRNLVPCIIAHGVFDAIQLFIILPVAMKMMPMT